MEDIAAKIQKIIAKADSTTHPEEAAVFMGKAQRMMIKHGLSLLDLGTLDTDDPVGILEDEDNLRNNGSAVWRFYLATTLAKYYGCRLVGVQRGTMKYWTIFGRLSARTTFQLMFPFVIRQVMKAGTEGAKAGRYPNAKQGHGMVATALQVRIAKLAEDQVAGDARGLNALVPLDVIELAIQDRYPSMRTTRNRGKYNAHAERDANGIGLNLQTGAAPRGTLRIG